ncbi:hypothetical protein CRU98_10075 [Arcobacter sp. CECT 8986]|uniref:hypothetical protein n=1 Tax=Arcobacter sp. CECT 8986 TaxID=2044507 RepID=UPI0010099466|nr:hypothetical protein [Arcobacter sp. CECT 8986]RXJ98376.1 hypothetical protein CRU98_10075 [Arcobacter sp. CECT 8986]
MAEKLTVEEQIQQAVLKAQRELELKQQQREQNIVKLGARVVSKRVQQGQPIIDKQSGNQKEVNGVPQCYPDKFYITLQFMGAELEKEVSKDNYDLVQEMHTYFCEGYVGEVKKFGNTYIEPIITRFTQI